MSIRRPDSSVIFIRQSYSVRQNGWSAISGEKTSVSELEPAPEGSEFHRAVWKLLCEIPYGEVAHNPVSVIISCHRVVGTDGGLTGHAGGLDRKVKPLTLEGVDMEAALTYFAVSTQLGNHLRYFATKAASTGAPDSTG